MYDFDTVRWATDALWTAIAERIPPAPAALTRDRPAETMWTDPDLLLAQTCGYPLVTALAGKVRVVATPCYDAPGCEGPLNRSAIVVRRDDPAGTLSDLRGRRAAVNAVTSNSGMNLLRREVADLAGGRPFFGKTLITGSHAASADAAASGEADVAAIDPVTWTQLAAAAPDTFRALRVLAWTRPTPGLPLITAMQTTETRLGDIRRALDGAAADPALADVRTALRLKGFAAPHAYDAILEIEREAAGLGYPTLV
jgi:ABC-type phosphate/phosphonate transport system substrate-binding protein